MSSMELAMLLTLKDMASSGLGKFSGQVQQTSAKLMAMGQASKMMGQRMMDAMQAPVKAFMEAEDAAIRLKVATMDSSGRASKDFEAMSEAAEKMGIRLPGTTSQFQRMFAALVKEGIRTEDILNGVADATGNLAVVLGMDFEAAATFTGQLAGSIKIAAKDMTAFMDLVQKAYHLGISTHDLGYAFDKAAGSFSKYNVAGLQAAQDLLPIFATLIKAGGMSGETLGTNWVAFSDGLYDFQNSTSKAVLKIKSDMKGLGVDLKFFDGRTFLGGDNMMAQLDQIRKLPIALQDAFAKNAFGGGADAQIFQILAAKGSEGINEVQRRLDEQANLGQRIAELQLSLVNIWESAQGAFEATLGKIGKAIAPELKLLANMFADASDKLGEFIEQHPRLTKIAAAVFAIGGGAMVAGGTVLFGLGAVLSIFGPIGAAVSFVSIKFYALWSMLLKIGVWNAAAGARLTAWVAAIPGRFAALFAHIGMFFRGIPGAIFGFFRAIPVFFASMGARIVSVFAGLGRFIMAPFRLFMGLPGLIMRTPQLLWGAVAAFKALGLAALANPVGLIVAGIAFAALLIYKYWQPIKGFFSGLWEGLKGGVSDLAPTFMASIAPLAPIFAPVIGVLQRLWNWFTQLIQPVNDVGGAGASMGRQVGLAIAGIIQGASALLAAFINLPTSLYSIGANMAQGLINGFKSIPLIGPLVGRLGGAIAAMKGPKGADTHSPSRVTMWIGDMMGTGLELGMNATAARLARAASQMAQAATPTFAPVGAPVAQSPALARAAGSGSPMGSGSSVIHYSPQITVAAGVPGGVAEQLQPVLHDDYDNFVRNIRRYLHDKERVDWA